MNLENELDSISKKERDSCLGLRDITVDYENLKSEYNLVTRGYLTLEKYDELRELYEHLHTDFCAINNEKMAIKEDLNNASTKMELLAAKDKQISDLLNNLRNNSSEEVRK